MKLPDDTTILIVEDNEAHARLIDIYMKQAGFVHPTLFIERGDDAIDFLFGREGGSGSLVVFLDLNLPGVHGHEILKKMKQTSKTLDIPVIVVTSSVDPQEGERCMGLGADAFMLKPPTPVALRETFRSLSLLCEVGDDDSGSDVV